jgi:hypothetical protein
VVLPMEVATTGTAQWFESLGGDAWVKEHLKGGDAMLSGQVPSPGLATARSIRR